MEIGQDSVTVNGRELVKPFIERPAIVRRDKDVSILYFHSSQVGRTRLLEGCAMHDVCGAGDLSNQITRMFHLLALVWSAYLMVAQTGRRICGD